MHFSMEEALEPPIKQGPTPYGIKKHLKWPSWLTWQNIRGSNKTEISQKAHSLPTHYPIHNPHFSHNLTLKVFLAEILF